MVAGHFANVDAFGIGPAFFEQHRVCQIVVNDAIGSAQQIATAHGDQARIARPCTDQIDSPVCRFGAVRVAVGNRPYRLLDHRHLSFLRSRCHISGGACIRQKAGSAIG